MRRTRSSTTAELLLLLGLLVGCAPAAAEPVVDGGWEVTIYYTAVESLHSSPPVAVTGCLVLDCSNGSDDLGRHPRTFVQAVQDEGTGRITSGEHAGRYLNWASTEGYWLDDAPRDASARALEPFRSAAADGVEQGTRIVLRDCGRAYGGGPPNPEVCELLRAGDWEIRDEFTPGLGGDRHIDLYIGEEDRPGFTSSPLYTSFTDAVLVLTAP